jgi:hypothetical protein
MTICFQRQFVKSPATDPGYDLYWKDSYMIIFTLILALMLLKLIAYLVIGLYTLSLAYVTLYCILQFHLLIKYGKGKRNGLHASEIGSSILGELPTVTVQLPFIQ